MNFLFPFYGAISPTASDMQRIRDNNLPKAPLFGAFAAYMCAIALASACCLAVPGLTRCVRAQKRRKNSVQRYNRKLAVFWLCAAGLALLAAMLLAIGASGAFSGLYLRKMNANAVTALDAVAEDQLDEHYLDAADSSYRELFELYVGYIKAAFEHNVPVPPAVKQSSAALEDFDIIKTAKPADFAVLPDQSGNRALAFVHFFANLFGASAHATLTQLRDLGVDVFGAELRLFDQDASEAEILKILTFADDVKDAFRAGDFLRQFESAAKDRKDAANALRKKLQGQHAALLRDFDATTVQQDFVANLATTGFAKSVLRNLPVAAPVLAAGLPALWAAGLAAGVVVLACAVARDRKSGQGAAKRQPKCFSCLPGCRFYAAGACCATALPLVVLHYSIVLNNGFHGVFGKDIDFRLLRPYFGAPVAQVAPAEHVLQKGAFSAFDPTVLQLSLANQQAFGASFSTNMTYSRRVSFYTGQEAQISASCAVSLADFAPNSRIQPLGRSWLCSYLRYDNELLNTFKTLRIDPQAAEVADGNILFQIRANLARLRRIFDQKADFTILPNGTQQCRSMRPIQVLKTSIQPILNASDALASYQRAGLSDGLTLQIANRDNFIILFSLLNSLHYALSDVRTGAQALLIYYGSAAFAAYYENRASESELRAALEALSGAEIFALKELKEDKDGAFQSAAPYLFTLTQAELDAFADFTATDQFESDFARRFSANTDYLIKIQQSFSFCCQSSFPCSFSSLFNNALRSVQFAARFQRADVILSRIKTNAAFGEEIDDYLSQICVAAHFNLAAVQSRLETSAAAREINLRIRKVLGDDLDFDLKKAKDLSDLSAAALLNARTLQAGQVGAGVLALLLLAAGFAVLPEFLGKSAAQESCVAQDEQRSGGVIGFDAATADEITQQRQMMLERVARAQHSEQ